MEEATRYLRELQSSHRHNESRDHGKRRLNHQGTKAPSKPWCLGGKKSSPGYSFSTSLVQSAFNAVRTASRRRAIAGMLAMLSSFAAMICRHGERSPFSSLPVTRLSFRVSSSFFI